MSIRNIFLIVMLCAFNTMKSQTFFDEVLNVQWEGTGMLMGNEAHFKMHWAPVLKGQFVQLTFENSYILSDGNDRKMEAYGFYKIVNDTVIKGNWFDSRGMNLPLKGTISPNNLTVFWGSPDTEQGKTVYTYDADFISVTDYFLNKEGSYIKFGEATYRRKND